jgi:hypothetical protein
LSVTCGRSVVFSTNKSDHQWYDWNIVENSIKHHCPSPNVFTFLFFSNRTLQASTLYIPVPHSWHPSFTVCTSCTWCLSQSVHVCFCWTTITWGFFASHVLHACEHWQLGQPLLSLLPNTYPCSHVAIQEIVASQVNVVWWLHSLHTSSKAENTIRSIHEWVPVVEEELFTLPEHPSLSQVFRVRLELNP